MRLRVRFGSDLSAVGRDNERVVTLSMPLSALSSPGADPNTPVVSRVPVNGKAHLVSPLSNDLYDSSAKLVLVGNDDDTEEESSKQDAIPGGLGAVAGVAVGLALLGMVIGYAINKSRSREVHRFMMSSVGSVSLGTPDSAKSSLDMVTLGHPDAEDQATTLTQEV